MSASIQEISLTIVTEQTGFRGRKRTTEEAICLKTARGNIYLKKSAVEGAGNSWKLLLRRLENLAAEKQIPFADLRNSAV